MHGVAAQQSYGHVVNGSSATQTKAMRFNLKSATHFGGTSACTATVLAWLFAPTADPQVKNPHEQLDMWFLTWGSLGVQDRKETRIAWKLALETFLN